MPAQGQPSPGALVLQEREEEESSELGAPRHQGVTAPGSFSGHSEEFPPAATSALSTLNQEMVSWCPFRPDASGPLSSLRSRPSMPGAAEAARSLRPPVPIRSDPTSHLQHLPRAGLPCSDAYPTPTPAASWPWGEVSGDEGPTKASRPDTPYSFFVSRHSPPCGPDTSPHTARLKASCRRGAAQGMTSALRAPAPVTHAERLTETSPPRAP